MSTSPETVQNKEVVDDHSTVKKINKLLNLSKTRIEGWQLLNSFLPQCPDEDFLQFCTSWMQHCCKTDTSIKNRDYSIYLLNDLFKISSNFQELKKSVSFFITTRYFDYFFKHLLNSQAGWHCTESCLLYYRGACGPFQITLEKYLKNEMEKNEKIPLIIGRCFALMPCLGGGGNDDANYVKNWKTQFVNILSTCNSILNKLFADVEEFQEYETLEQKHNNYEKEESAENLTIRLQNYLIILDCMLLNKYPAPKNVPSDLIFQLVCRGLSLNSKALRKQDIASVISLKKVLPDVQCGLLSLLKAVIVTCKNQLLPYSHLICKLIKQILEWTESDFTYENGRPSELLRILAYETLCDWLAVSRNGSCVEVISSVVVSNAVIDIKSKESVVLLKETKLKNHFKSKKSKTRRIDATANRRLCYAALKTLQFLLKFTGVLLKAEEHKFLQEFVVKSVMEMLKHSSPDIPVPFDVIACRTELYSLLLELVIQPCPKWPPPTNYALRLFREGRNDPSPEVSSFCSAALNFATIIIHPQYDNGGFPLNEMPNDTNGAEWERHCRGGEELMEVENGKVSEPEISVEKITESESFELNKREEPKKLHDSTEDSNISSDEDSRNTVTFTKDSSDLEKTNFSMDKTLTVNLSPQTHQANDEPHTKEQRISTQESTPEKTFSPVKEKPTESNSIKETSENNKMKNSESPHSEEVITSKNVSPEPMNEESHPKARYFLRSKTKASSEEPEEAAKRTSSPEILKNTPNKIITRSTPSIQSAKKRPRTRALSRADTNSETEAKTPEKKSREVEENSDAGRSKDNVDNDGGDGDEEEIKAAFDDSFVD